MMSVRISSILACAAGLQLTLALPAVARAETPPRVSQLSDSASALAAQVANISNSTTLSTSKKERMIALSVRTSVAGTIAGISDPDFKLGAAIELAIAAAQAAPAQREVIIKAAAFTPGVREIASASQTIRSAVANPPPRPKQTRVAAGKVATRKVVPSASPSAVKKTSTPRTVAPAAPRPETSSESLERPSPGPQGGAWTRTAEGSAKARAVDLQKTTKLTWLLDANARFDNNVYLTRSDKVSDTIYSVRPGLEFKSGENASTRVEATYHQEFTRSSRGTSPSESLANGELSISHGTGRSQLSVGAEVEQSNQNNRDVVIQGRREIFRTDRYSFNFRGEAPVTARTSLSAGIGYSLVNFPTGAFLDHRDFEMPINMYYAMTPRLDLSAGASLRKTTAPGTEGGSSSYYYNLGVRGEITPKVSGQLSVGARQLQAKGASGTFTLGTQGAVSWAMSPRANLSLSLSRDFRTSAQGQQLINSQASLSFVHSTSLFWQNGASASVGRFAYGPVIFIPNSGSIPVFSDRSDTYSEFSIFTRYQLNRWLSTGVDVSYRNNSSSVEGVNFDGYLLNLLIGLSY